MFNAIIVEDEKPILELMKHLIGRNPCYNIVGSFSNPLEALERFAELRPDVAFLDVEMPKLNGIELAHKLLDISERTQVVFTTAYKHYALDAFGVSAVDYILKPVTPAAIERVTNRLLKQLHPAATAEQEVRQASIRCFGGFEVRNPDGAPVKMADPQNGELFAFFLCHPWQDIGKWRLMDLLWPEMDEERASHNLYNTVYRLKKLLTENDIRLDVQKTNDGYRLEGQEASCDLLDYQKNAGSLPGGRTNPQLAERLTAMYRGPLFENKDYMWKTSLEIAYASQYSAWVRELFLLDREAARTDMAERRLEAYLATYPLDEEMNRALADLYRASGQTDRLARHLARFASAYRSELGLEPPQL